MAFFARLYRYQNDAYSALHKLCPLGTRPQAESPLRGEAPIKGAATIFRHNF